MSYTYKYPRPALTADCVEITREKQPSILLKQRGNEPFKGSWALPGGFMEMDETVEQCAMRELEEETGLKVTEVHQVKTYSGVNRDPRGRIVTVASLAIIDKPQEVAGQDDAAGAKWFPLDALPPLAADHADIIRDAKVLYDHILYFQSQKTNSNMSGNRITPNMITSLKPNEVFVFGSNLKGMHGGGAARIAYEKFGAIMGQGVGLQGQSYGIPTMHGGVNEIKPYVDEFIDFAREHKELTFLVTRIGCGIAGFRDEEIAPLFAEAHALENVTLPRGW
ncbi:MAG: NUDIX domain-containing protein [Bacteroidaceae bacterium]|nr:NUDIX domain-containing protein [Bacteroidaceae bacterium]